MLGFMGLGHLNESDERILNKPKPFYRCGDYSDNRESVQIQNGTANDSYQ
jgi:hypothetical protein